MPSAATDIESLLQSQAIVETINLQIDAEEHGRCNPVKRKQGDEEPSEEITEPRLRPRMRIKDRDLVAGKDGEMCRIVGSSGDISREHRGRTQERGLARNMVHAGESSRARFTRDWGLIQKKRDLIRGFGVEGMIWRMLISSTPCI